MPVICHTTDKKLNILNSERFTIESITDTKLIIKDDYRTIELKTCDFHKFFY